MFQPIVAGNAGIIFENRLLGLCHVINVLNVSGTAKSPNLVSLQIFVE